MGCEAVQRGEAGVVGPLWPMDWTTNMTETPRISPDNAPTRNDLRCMAVAPVAREVKTVFPPGKSL
jgi:hypothetical protein